MPHNSQEKGDWDPPSYPLLFACIAGKLRIIEREIRRDSARDEKATGITTTQLFFLELVTSEPGQRLSNIANSLSIHQATSSNIKRILIKKGLIEQRPEAQDRRVILLYPTLRGIELAAKAKQRGQSPLRKAVEDMPADELRMLNVLLGNLTDRIEEIYASEEEEGGESKPAD